jgi:hypothetical protein
MYMDLHHLHHPLSNILEHQLNITRDSWGWRYVVLGPTGLHQALETSIIDYLEWLQTLRDPTNNFSPSLPHLLYMRIYCLPLPKLMLHQYQSYELVWWPEKNLPPLCLPSSLMKCCLSFPLLFFSLKSWWLCIEDVSMWWRVRNVK